MRKVEIEKHNNNKCNGNSFVSWLQLATPLVLFWFILSGIFEIKFILYGCGTCLLVSLICFRHMTISGRKTNREYYILNLNWPRLIAYLFWLMIEILKANIYVAKLILFKRDELNPQIVWFKADYDHPVARVLLANSITITPGTITVDIFADGVFSVHAITDELAQGVLDMGMQEKVAWVFGENPIFEKLDYVYDESLKESPSAKLKHNRFKKKVKAL